ncbi:MAG: ribonuclease P protein component [Dehalococcoidia bacterium]
MADQSLQREKRIRQRSDFDSLRRDGVSRAHPLVVIRAVPNGLPHARFGFIVGRRVSTKAVHRNRVKRRLREIVRRSSVHPGWDLLFIARRPAVEADFGTLRRAVLDLERRAGVQLPVQGPAARDGEPVVEA